METALHPNGKVKSITYTVNDLLHRDDGPAYQHWNDVGVLVYEEWCQNDCWYRDNGPAVQQWNPAGELTLEIWYQNDRMHRDNGPAYQQWNAAGELIREKWCQNNRELTLQEVEKILRPAEFMHTLRAGLPQPIFEEIESVFRAV
jgi:antitoxin component YwqK of YwqJK toxin-antitoxin module